MHASALLPKITVASLHSAKNHCCSLAPCLGIGLSMYELEFVNSPSAHLSRTLRFFLKIAIIGVFTPSLNKEFRLSVTLRAKKLNLAIAFECCFINLCE